jgi:hypothetical protein
MKGQATHMLPTPSLIHIFNTGYMVVQPTMDN